MATLAARIARGALASVAILYLALPIVAVLLYTVADRWTQHVLPDRYTLSVWQEALADRRLWAAVWRTAWLSAVVVLVDLALVVPSVYWQRVHNPRIRLVNDVLAALPFSLPFIVLAYGLLDLIGAHMPVLLGTWYLLLVVHVAVTFPYLYWSLDGAMAAARVAQLEEMAAVCGAGSLQTLRWVILPIVWPALVAGGLVAFAAGYGELTFAQLLVGARFLTVEVYGMNLFSDTSASYGRLACLTVVNFVLLAGITLVIIAAQRSTEARQLRRTAALRAAA